MDTKLLSIMNMHFVRNTDIAIFFNMHMTDYTTLTKFANLNCMMSNMFINYITKNAVLEMFCNIQRFIHSIYRLKHIWRFKRSKVYNTDDLYMNPFQPNAKNVIVLLQNKTKYVFHIRELISTMDTSLTNSSHFFSDPIAYKNPYTNLAFNKSNLYNIYFAVKSSNYIMPILLQKYFLSDFNLSIFASQNEYLVNEEYLKTYVANNCYVNLYRRVYDMFDEHKLLRFKIHPEFPKDILFKIMKPYLELYYISLYSMNEYNKNRANNLLHKKLRQFTKFNPSFGRKKMKLTKASPFSNTKSKKIVFDDKHICFYEKRLSTGDFLHTHLYKKPMYETFYAHTPVMNLSVAPVNQHSYFEDDSDEGMPGLIPINEIGPDVRFNMEDYDDNEDEDDDETVIYEDENANANEDENETVNENNSESGEDDSEDETGEESESDENNSDSDSENGNVPNEYETDDYVYEAHLDEVD